MLKSVEGVYRDGKIELTERPRDVRDETRVIVTFLETSHIDLRARGLDEAQAAGLRAQLGAFAEEWDSPGMDRYDNYEPRKPSSNRGDVVLVLYPNSDLRTAKTRPMRWVTAQTARLTHPTLTGQQQAVFVRDGSGRRRSA